MSAQRLSADLFERAFSEAKSDKGHRSLTNLRAACDFLDEKGIEITVRSAGDYCRGKPFGPLPQSIRNNRHLKAYLDARRAEQALLPPKKSGAPDVVRSGNVNIDSYIQTLEFELARTRAQLRSLRQAIPTLGQFDLESATREGVLSLASGGGRLPPEAEAAVRRLLDARALESCGLVLAETGHVIAPDQNGASLLTRKQVDALRRLLAQPPQVSVAQEI